MLLRSQKQQHCYCCPMNSKGPRPSADLRYKIEDSAYNCQCFFLEHGSQFIITRPGVAGAVL